MRGNERLKNILFKHLPQFNLRVFQLEKALFKKDFSQSG